MPKQPRTKPVSAAQVRSYAAKAAEFAEIARDLRRLLPLKTSAAYDPDDIARAVAAKAVERAQRCSAVASRVASTMR